MRLAVLTVLGLLVFAPVGSAGSDSSAAGSLYATVGTSTIRVTNTTGGTVRRVPAGVYLVLVKDKSKRRSFHLVGSNINRKTSLRFVGAVTWRLRLTKGTYHYYSDAGRGLRGKFVAQ